MKKLKTILVGLVFVVLVAQFIGPSRTNPPVDEHKTVAALTDIPPEVLKVIQRSCFDCHSHQTVWPWYSHVAPVSWLVINDVNEGRRHVNFSNFAQYDRKKLKNVFIDICEELEDRTMPLPKYLKMHEQAKLTSAEIEMICQWTDAELDKLESAAADTTDEQ